MLNADDVHIAHFLPGRVRIKAAALKGNPGQAEQLSAAFRAVPGVKSIDCNTLTGSALIQYDTRRIVEADAAQTLAKVLKQELPGLDVDEVLKWLGAPPQG